MAILGSPKLSKARESAVTSIKASADQVKAGTLHRQSKFCFSKGLAAKGREFQTLRIDRKHASSAHPLVAFGAQMVSTELNCQIITLFVI